MKHAMILAASVFAGALSFAAVAADAPKKELTPQQQKMADCAHQSKGMKGAEHQKFMSDCLKGKAGETKGGEMKPMPKEEPKPVGMANPDAKKPTQTEKMKACNTEANGKKLKGDDRKKFMSDCLKG